MDPQVSELDEAIADDRAEDVHKMIISDTPQLCSPRDTQLLARIILMYKAHSSTVEHLLKCYYKPNYPVDYGSSERLKIAGKLITMDMSPLHLAMYEGNADIVRLLLAYGADINKKTELGKTALHIACTLGRTDLVRLLIHSGCDINIMDTGNNSALGYAINAQQAQPVKILIQAGACLEDINDCDMTLLDLALFFYQSDIISYLLKAGYDCNQHFQLRDSFVYYSDHYTNSILYSLVMNNDLGNTCLLLKCGYEKRHKEYHSILRSSPVVQSFLQPDLPHYELMCYLDHAVSNPYSLADLSRITTRSILNSTRTTRGGSLYDLVDRLPLPNKLKGFLCFDS